MVPVTSRSTPKIALVVFLLFLSTGAWLIIPRVMGQTNATSVLYVSPISSTGPVGSSFSVNVNLNLSSNDAINYFEIYVRYYDGTPPCANSHCVLNPTSVSLGNFVDPSQVLLSSGCIDGVAIGGGSGCTINDGGGIVHYLVDFAPVTQGPKSATLFTINFSVAGRGSSLLEIVSQQLINPGQVPYPNAHPILVETRDGVFSNGGVGALFNASPAIPLIDSPVYFDASGSFNSSGVPPTSFSWNFGDGSRIAIKSIPFVSHNYTTAGQYRVSMAVTAGSTGNVSKTITVVSALGRLSILVKDTGGNNINLPVVVELYNGTTLVYNTTRVAGAPDSTLFSNLDPGNYSVTLKGPKITTFSKTEIVTAGWTTVDSVYLEVARAPTVTTSPSDAPLIFWLSLVGGAVAVGGVTLFLRRRARPRKKRSAT